MSSTEQRNMELMQTLDDSFNAQDFDTFTHRHRADVVVNLTGVAPTHDIKAHRDDAMNIFKTFPNQRVDNRPYKVFFASGDWTCSIARYTGTMTGSMRTPDGQEIPPTGKSFDVDLCTVAQWDNNGQIIQEIIFYDLATMMRQLGL